MLLFYGELPWKARYSTALRFKDILEMKTIKYPEEIWPNLPSNLYIS
jgi:hypothetical protein